MKLVITEKSSLSKNSRIFALRDDTVQFIMSRRSA